MGAHGQLVQALVFELLPHARLSPGTPEQLKTSAHDPAAALSGLGVAPSSSSAPRPHDSFSNDLATIAEDRLTSSTLTKDGPPPHVADDLAPSTAPVAKDGLLPPADDLLRGLSVLSQIPVMATLIDEELGPVFQNELSRR